MHSNKKLRITHWNAQGITTISSATQLQLFLDQEKSDIAMLNLLKKLHKFYLNGYRIHRNDRDSNGGVVAIAVKHSISHTRLPNYKTTSIENLSIAVKINGRNIVLTSAYNPKYHSSFENDIKKITPSDKEFFVFGDLNAKSTAWYVTTLLAMF